MTETTIRDHVQYTADVAMPAATRPAIGDTRTRTRTVWLPTFTDAGIVWPFARIRVTERYDVAPTRPELYGEELFFPEPPRWRRVTVERA